MPEGPEIRIQIDLLKGFIGKTIIGMNHNEKSKFNKHKIKGLHLIKLPVKLNNIFCRGKTIFFEGLTRQNKIIYMVSQLGMTGKWYWSKEGKLKPAKHSDFWIDFGRPSKSFKGKWVLQYRLYFNDMRHFGNFNIYDKDTIDEVWKKHGPCLLTTALYNKGIDKKLNNHQKIITKEKYIEKLSDKRLKNKQICGFMLEQKYFSGIGNYLRAEILYSSKIRPDKLLSELSNDEKEKLYKYSLDVILRAYLTQGPPNGYIPEGSFTLKCYNREYDPYGNPVVRQRFKDNRTIHWVPKIQK